jgi:hypothetical protein
MSLDFYDSYGQPYAYTDDGKHIYSFKGIPIAYVSDDSIYSFSGAHIGYFNEGMIRDRNGDVLLFTNVASGGPMKPMKKMKPLKNLKQMRPMKGMRQMRPMRPMKTIGWSSYAPGNIFGV